MHTLFLFLMTLMFSCFSTNTVQAGNNQKNIRIAAIDWCPQLCPNDKNRGYIYDIVKAIFADSEFNLSIETMPWSRAIVLTRRGETLALLSPAKSEAPDLLFPNMHVGMQQMCFFTRVESNWTYQGEDSLQDMQIGIARDTSIEELNVYIQSHLPQFQFQTYGDHYILSSLRKLIASRIDAFLFTHNTTKFEIKKLGWQDDFREAGCVSQAKIYMAFSPDSKVAETVEAMILRFEDEMGNLQGSEQLIDILAKYGLDEGFK